MLPSATVTKKDGSTGVVVPAPDGVLAIIAPSASGTANSPGGYTDPRTAQTDFGYGMLAEAAAYVMAVTGKQCVLVKGTASTPSALVGSVVLTGTGTSVPTCAAPAAIDDFDVLVTVLLGGTVATGPIQYTTSLDGGKTQSGVMDLGVATSITIPNSGVVIALAAGTLVKGDTISFKVLGPRMTSGNVSTALEALRVSSLLWDQVLILGVDADASLVAVVDAWIAALEAAGFFPTAIVNARPKAASETEAAYLTAMGTAWNGASTINVVVCADACDLPSLLPGRGIARQARPVSLAVAARTMAVDIAEDPAYVTSGGVKYASLVDDRGNPKYHDEQKNPGLDDLRLTTLRTWPRRNGPFVTNAKMLSPAGSDYVYIQQARVMNRACDLANQTLSAQCSIGIHRKKSTGKITEADAQKIEGLVQKQFDAQLGPKRVSSATFALSRTDDLTSNGPATLTYSIEIDGLRYVKTFSGEAHFV